MRKKLYILHGAIKMMHTNTRGEEILDIMKKEMIKEMKFQFIIKFKVNR